MVNKIDSGGGSGNGGRGGVPHNSVSVPWYVEWEKRDIGNNKSSEFRNMKWFCGKKRPTNSSSAAEHGTLARVISRVSQTIVSFYFGNASYVVGNGGGDGDRFCRCCGSVGACGFIVVRRRCS
jgi:hypothetical protein